MMKVAANMAELIGETPIVRLQRVVPDDAANLFLKLESFNPTGSVKDRAAFNMIQVAEQEGVITPGGTIIEPTSGNTGIGLAMNAAAKGYRAIMVMPDNSTQERINLLKAYGAEVYLTPSAEKMPGAIQKAEKLQASIPNSFIPQQFENRANPDIHRTTTALEIMDQMDGKLDAFVATAGTGGTITGTGEVLKEKLPNLHITVAEPASSPVLSGGEPGPHKLVGTSPGFVPSILNTSIYDEIMQIKDDEAIDMFQTLPKKEGVLIGLSGAAAVLAAIRVAKRLGKDKNVLCMEPDTGQRYLSMGLIE